MRLFIFFLFITLSSPAHSNSATEAFRTNQQKISAHFQSIEKELSALPSVLLQEQKHVMLAITYFFQNEVLPHIQQEQNEIFPLLEKLTKRIDNCMPYENSTLIQWIGSVQYLANVETMDVPVFITQVYDLLGALKLHFKTVDEIILPSIEHQVGSNSCSLTEKTQESN